MKEPPLSGNGHMRMWSPADLAISSRRRSRAGMARAVVAEKGAGCRVIGSIALGAISLRVCIRTCVDVRGVVVAGVIIVVAGRGERAAAERARCQTHNIGTSPTPTPHKTPNA